ncbi:MAG: major capsid protein [Acetobacter sp.]|uniref:major capsid protein n=1 Tax=Acetobacter sp. TaxID=440 RepID=UPI0039E8506D
MQGEIASLSDALSIYQTAELVYFVRNLKLAQNFLLDRFFPNIIDADAPEVAIDVDFGLRRMAPFASPLVEAKPVESRRWGTNLFKPAYIKDLRNPDLLKPVRRNIGERLMGAMSPQDRLEANLSWEMADQLDMINRRLEWMAASALVSSSVTIVGEGYPTPMVVDYVRDPSLTIALTGSAQWGQNGVYPSDYITAWSALMLQKSGAAPTDIIFTNSTWNAFKNDIKVLNAIWMDRSGSSNVNLGGAMKQGAMYMGQWGQFTLWLYNDWYIDPVTGEETPMIPDGTVILTSPYLEGVRAFGQIIDPEFNYQSVPYAPKLWIEKNPAVINLMMQSAPLIIPSRPNASLAATVMAAGSAVPAPTV